MCKDEINEEKVESEKMLFYEEELEKDTTNQIKILFVGENNQRQKFLESDLEFCELNKNNLDEVEKLNQLTLSVKYNKQFYARFMKKDSENNLNQLPSFWTKLAFLNKTLIAAICCTIEYELIDKENINNHVNILKKNVLENFKNYCKLNIQTLACRIDKRQSGVASILMLKLIEFCKNENKKTLSIIQTEKLNNNFKLNSNFFPPIQLIYLHCQTSNEAALNFYKKFGFKIVQFCEGYYGKRFEKPDAYRLELFFY